MSARWELVKSGQGAARRTVYHACKAHAPSGFRLAVSPRGDVWRWAVYDMAQGSTSGGLLLDEGSTTTWASARRVAASKALSIWKRRQRASKATTEGLTP